MNKIRVLPDNLSNQIAAGEVVERPASVIKELVENSLDAEAKRLQIDVELGGRRLMRVADDGEGMLRDDAVLAFERHATSKITSLEDLSKIETLGFRGEALASIASVSKVELVTKMANETVGTRVNIEGGRLIDVKDAARTTGTTITIRDLFFNTPARRKFMRSEATENYHLTSIVTHYALANPEIAFTLNNNGREILRVSPARDLRERAFQIFGANLIESLLPLEGGREYVAKIKGYISSPRERRSTRDSQYFFINGRFVRDKIIAGGLLEGFRSVLPHGVYPVAFLFLEIPLEEVDVNVHPAKTEVRFRRSEAVKEVIAESVRGALKSAGILRENSDDPNLKLSNPEEFTGNVKTNFNPEQVVEQPKIQFVPSVKEEGGLVRNFLQEGQPKDVESENNIISFTKQPNVSAETVEENVELFPSEFEDQAQSRIQNVQNTVELETDTANQPSPENSGISKSNSFENFIFPPLNSAGKLVQVADAEHLKASNIRPLGQLRDSYIIALDDQGLLLVDQHVAHERILFDKFRRRETERKIESQNLLLPETIDLTPAQAAAFEIVKVELENLGFGLMQLSGRTIAVKSVPSDLPPSEARNLLAEVLDTVEKEKSGDAKAALRDGIAASLACKAAIKVNMTLTNEKMQWLIDKLLTTSSPTTCPHGRPIILRLTTRDIERGFHRP
ncbi:MAG: DNA mismatch repair endonuclease MutL [Pyrinomonadaceae bacterium]